MLLTCLPFCFFSSGNACRVPRPPRHRCTAAASASVENRRTFCRHRAQAFRSGETAHRGTFIGFFSVFNDTQTFCPYRTSHRVNLYTFSFFLPFLLAVVTARNVFEQVSSIRLSTTLCSCGRRFTLHARHTFRCRTIQDARTFTLTHTLTRDSHTH
jgi:hypothetical protein